MSEEAPVAPAIGLKDALRFTPAEMVNLRDDQLKALMSMVLTAQQTDRKENQILYYQPVSDVARRVWECNTRYQVVGGGNGASKTETMLTKLVALSTGLFPIGLEPDERAALMAQFRGPVNVRVVVESLTTTLNPIILPKLQWWQWSGTDSPGGQRGHWGWIPRRLLRQGSWVASWNEKTRLLRHLCVNPDNPDEVIGESMWQFMAHNQDPTDFASGDFHFVLHDELTKGAIWRENEARTMRVGGKMLMAFTWPDDASIPVDWVFDRLYEPSQAGPGKNPEISWFEMWTQDNKNLDQSSVKIQAGEWDETVKQARLYGRPIRFSNRVHPEFTNVDTWWCKRDKRKLFSPDACGHGEGDVVKYNHVEEFEAHPSLPTICLLDPHPRKPHMLLWVQIDTWDDWWVVAEAQVLGEPEDVRKEIDRVEMEFRLNTVTRIGDRNMLSSPSGKHRDVTWQDEFGAVGVRLELSDVSDVGRGRINDMLKLDPDRDGPRIHFHPRCALAIRQMLRYVWDEYRQQEGRDLKQTAKEKDDDYPTLLKYLANADPRFGYLMHGAPVIKTRGGR